MSRTGYLLVSLSLYLSPSLSLFLFTLWSALLSVKECLVCHFFSTKFVSRAIISNYHCSIRLVSTLTALTTICGTIPTLFETCISIHNHIYNTCICTFLLYRYTCIYNFFSLILPIYTLISTFLLTCFFQFWSFLELNLNNLYDCYLYMHLQYLENPVMSEAKFVLIF